MMVLSSSSTSATVAVENATSDGLMSPDRAMNIEICTSINSNHWQVEDVVKAVEKRLQHKNPKVQLRSLMLLDTMVQNCGDSVHFQIAEKKILEMMIKIVEKKMDFVGKCASDGKNLGVARLLARGFWGSWRKHPQCYNAYVELRKNALRKGLANRLQHKQSTMSANTCRRPTENDARMDREWPTSAVG